MSKSCCAWPWPSCAAMIAKCALSTSPRATAATFSKPCRAYRRCRDRKSTRLNSSHTVIYTLSLHDALPISMAKLRSDDRQVRIVDIAAGHGRYILEALQGVSPLPESILLRDYSDINVRDGGALIREKGLGDIAQFVKGDAFDRADLAALDPKPTLAVVSGLYELFADNAMVGASLAGLAEAVEPGGYLVYTGQPWHPQLELIARALTSHRQGQAWVMRRRSQAEMDQLVEAAGFRKITQRVDEWGIFTVSLAQKI